MSFSSLFHCITSLRTHIFHSLPGDGRRTAQPTHHNHSSWDRLSQPSFYYYGKNTWNSLLLKRIKWTYFSSVWRFPSMFGWSCFIRACGKAAWCQECVVERRPSPCQTPSRDPLTRWGSSLYHIVASLEHHPHESTMSHPFHEWASSRETKSSVTPSSTLTTCLSIRCLLCGLGLLWFLT